MAPPLAPDSVPGWDGAEPYAIDPGGGRNLRGDRWVAVRGPTPTGQAKWAGRQTWAAQIGAGCPMPSPYPAARRARMWPHDQRDASRPRPPPGPSLARRDPSARACPPRSVGPSLPAAIRRPEPARRDPSARARPPGRRPATGRQPPSGRPARWPRHVDRPAVGTTRFRARSVDPGRPPAQPTWPVRKSAARRLTGGDETGAGLESATSPGADRGPAPFPTLADYATVTATLFAPPATSISNRSGAASAPGLAIRPGLHASTPSSSALR